MVVVMDQFLVFDDFHLPDRSYIVGACRKRPSCHTDEKRDELALFQSIELHSITRAAGAGLKDISADQSASVSRPSYNPLLAAPHCIRVRFTSSTGPYLYASALRVRARSGCEQPQQSTLYSITSLARARTLGGISRRSSLAALRLI